MTIHRQSIAHAVLQALDARMRHPSELRRHALQYGKPAAVRLSIMRLQRAGLIECKVRITDQGRAELERLAHIGRKAAAVE